MEKKKKLLLLSGGIATTGAIAATLLLIRRRNRRKRGKPTHGSSNILTTDNKVLPPNFRNWKGGNGYMTKLPRGIRNNNPGNLVKTGIPWKGKVAPGRNKDGRFEMFIAPEYGIRALIKDLRNDIGKGRNTVPKLMKEFAPKFENNTDRYIATVLKDLKVGKDDRLLPTKNTLRLLVRSIGKVENGGNYITDELFEKAYRLI